MEQQSRLLVCFLAGNYLPTEVDYLSARLSNNRRRHHHRHPEPYLVHLTAPAPRGRSRNRCFVIAKGLLLTRN